MKKSVYTAPEIERVELDQLINLQLNSDPTPEEEPTDWVKNFNDSSFNNPVRT